MPRCDFCHSFVDDGSFIELKPSRYWIGSSCGCKGKSGEQLSQIIYFKSLPQKELMALKGGYLKLAANDYTDLSDKDHLLTSIKVMDMVLGVEE
ncbi:hypothetical protein QYG89_16450 [Bacillus sp. B190/17]|uniref:Uncharacterized protein n=1 Tax=Bacillus lumedeiriae TaxID=3058829 RepID=A0ABW8ICK9_9BACI